ncbi:MAG: hypothetical protein ACR2HY_10805 [Acidimicrobiales bacterium]
MTGPRSLCPHGFVADQCLICATLAPSGPVSGGRDPAEHRAGAKSLEGSRPGRARTRMGGTGLVALVALLVVGWWALAVVSLVLRLAQLVVVATAAGWVGWRLGVRHGRRSRAG